MGADEVYEQSVDGLQRVFSPEGAGSLNAVVQFTLTGDDGVEFFASIRERALGLERGRATSSKVTMRMDAHEFLDLLSGRLSASDAWLSGKLKVGGNLIYAMRLAPVFKFGAQS